MYRGLGSLLSQRIAHFLTGSSASSPKSKTVSTNKKVRVQVKALLTEKKPETTFGDHEQQLPCPVIPVGVFRACTGTTICRVVHRQRPHWIPVVVAFELAHNVHGTFVQAVGLSINDSIASSHCTFFFGAFWTTIRLSFTSSFCASFIQNHPKQYAD